MGKCLVAYFSATGTTKRVAESIAKSMDAYLYEIEAIIPYSDADLNWNDKNSRCYKEWKNKSSRPQIALPVENMQDYTVIFLGYPIWWEKAPNIIATFLESYDFSGKTIIPFSTSGGSIRGSIGLHLHKLCSKECNWKNGKLFRMVPNKTEILRWAEKIAIH